MDRYLTTKLPNPRTISPLRYLGGKSELARRICSFLGQAGELREVFAGGASVSLLALATGQVRSVWLNDLDRNVVAFWTEVLEHPDALISRWQDYGVSRKTVEAFQASLYPKVGKPDVLPPDELAFRRLVLSQQQYSGDPTGGIKDALRVKDQGSITDRVNVAHDLLAGRAKVTRLDFEEIIAAPGNNVVLYLDPPYFDAGEMYHCSLQPEDHARLRDALRQTKHRWVLSYDDHPAVRELYGGWCDITIIADYTSGMHVGEKPKRAELLITPRRGPGRPHRDDHDVLEDILAVLMDNAPWRNHRTAHKRHEAWVADGSLFSRLHQHAVRLGKMDGTKDRARQIQEWLDRADIHR